jgi:hypothetical protein
MPRTQRIAENAENAENVGNIENTENAENAKNAEKAMAWAAILSSPTLGICSHFCQVINYS